MTPAPSPLILEAWAAITLCLLGMGLLFRRAAGTPICGAQDLLLSFWIGCMCLLFFLQVWHIWQRVDGVALAMAVAAGSLGLLSSWRDVWRRLGGRLIGGWPVIVLGILIAVWLSNRALGGPQNGDSGLYHAPVVRWYSEYPLVVGLGNLNSRYALNQSYFLLASLIDRGVFLHRSHHLTNGVLLLPLLLRCVLAIWHLLTRKGATPGQELFYALLFPAAVDLALHINLTSPSPDVVVFVLGVVLCGQLLDFIQRTQRGTVRPFDFTIIALLAAGGFTLKLSLAGLAISVVLVALAVRFAKRPFAHADGRRALVTLGAVGVIGIGPWVARSIWMSGYPFFPSLLIGVPVAWRVPVDWSVNILPGSSWWWDGMSDLGHLRQRLLSFGWGDRSIVLPLLIGVLIALAALPLARRSGSSRRQALPLLILLPPLVSLVFNGLSASMARYVGPAAWLLAVQMLVLLESRLHRQSIWARRTLAIVCLLGWIPLVDGRPLLRELNDFEPTVTPQLTQRPLPSGFILNVPSADQGCWYAAIPCSSDVNSKLIEHDAGNGTFYFTTGP